MTAAQSQALKTLWRSPKLHTMIRHTKALYPNALLLSKGKNQPDVESHSHQLWSKMHWSSPYYGTHAIKQRGKLWKFIKLTLKDYYQGQGGKITTSLFLEKIMHNWSTQGLGHFNCSPCHCFARHNFHHTWRHYKTIPFGSWFMHFSVHFNSFQ